MKNARIGVLLLALASGQCTRESPTAPSAFGAIGLVPGWRTAVLVGAGDIGMCDVPEVAAVGRLVATTPGEVFLAGDIAYPSGRAVDFRDCFEPYWGHARDRWHATPGNHEYESAAATPYFDYFGEAAGPAGVGFYQLMIGEWLVLMLNSELPAAPGSPQYEFVRAALQSRPVRCQIAIWHRPLFSSGPHSPHRAMRDLWRLLDTNGADVVIGAHDHLYERFAPQDADGRLDDQGIRQFTVGTGGATLYDFVRQTPNSLARIGAHGIIRLTLRPESYSWEFLDVKGGVADSGFDVCQ